MERVAAKHGVERADDWKKVTHSSIAAMGGRGLLNRFGGSVLRLLQDTFPEKKMEHAQCRKSYPHSHWDSQEARRAFLDRVAAEHRVEQETDWKRVTVKHVLDMGGSGLLERFSGSLFAALADAYPERGYQASRCRAKLPQGYWQEEENRKDFMDALARQHGVKTAADWRRVGIQEVQAAGGAGLLSRYNNNVSRLLHDVYPDLQGAQQTREIRDKVPKGYWLQRANRRLFLEDVARHMGIQSPEDWGKVSSKDIVRFGGASLLRRFSSPLAAAIDSFSEMDFSGVRPKRTPRVTWESRAQRRAFMDRVAERYNVKSQEDWQRVRAEDIRSLGGTGLLSRFPSMFALLRDTYGAESGTEDEHQSWDPLLCRSRVPRNYWAQEENIRDFLERAKEKLQIKEKEDWYRISYKQLSSLGGGTLFTRGRFVDALRAAYPEEEWDERALQNSAKKSSQRQLHLVAKQFFPSHRIVEDHKHELLPSQGKSLELDLYLPDIELAIEYNGKHHYEELPFFGPLEVYQRRDAEKRRMCKDIGIRVLTIPYWWDYTPEAFAASLHAAFPAAVEEILAKEKDLGEEARAILLKVQVGSVSPIPSAPISQGSVNEACLTAAEEANVSGLLIADFFQGTQAQWIQEEGDMTSLAGRKLCAPPEWKSHLGRQSLDGRLLQKE